MEKFIKDLEQAVDMMVRARTAFLDELVADAQEQGGYGIF